METSSIELNELAKALIKAQSEMENAKKGAENPFFKSKYADLSSVREASMEILNKHGLCIIQTMHSENGDKIGVITTLLHESGQYIRGELSIVPPKNDPQAIGSLITYFRRYSWQSIIALSADDDDAEKTMERKQPKKEPIRSTPEKSKRALNLSQGKRIIVLGQKRDLNERETKIVIDWYCAKNGRTFKSGEYIINNFDVVLNDYLNSIKQYEAESTNEKEVDDIPF